MKRAAGFTLIELVIVIVILGILGAVAAPKFLNLQGDAYGANLDGLKNSMESGATLANTKAILKGVDKKETTTAAVDLGDGVQAKLVWGYPAASADGILKVIDANASSAKSTEVDYYYTGSADTAGNTLTIYPQARESVTDCSVTYQTATSTSRPTIEIKKSGC